MGKGRPRGTCGLARPDMVFRARLLDGAGGRVARILWQFKLQIKTYISRSITPTYIQKMLSRSPATRKIVSKNYLMSLFSKLLSLTFPNFRFMAPEVNLFFNLTIHIFVQLIQALLNSNKVLYNKMNLFERRLLIIILLFLKKVVPTLVESSLTSCLLF